MGARPVPEEVDAPGRSGRVNHFDFDLVRRNASPQRGLYASLRHSSIRGEYHHHGNRLRHIDGEDRERVGRLFPARCG